MLTHLRSFVPRSFRAVILRNKIARAALRLVIGREQIRPHPYCPCELGFDGHKQIGWSLGGLAVWEAPYFKVAGDLFDLIQPRVIWDIGANVGAYSLFFASRQPVPQCVVAFEPDPANLVMLACNVERNKLSNIVSIRPVALSDREGEAVFDSDPYTGSMGSLETHSGMMMKYGGGRPVPMVVMANTIDRELQESQPPDFVKVDVEGHEYSLLQGGRALLANHRPCIMMEISGESRARTLELLSTSGYVVCNAATLEQCGDNDFETIAIPVERAATILAELKYRQSLINE